MGSSMERRSMINKRIARKLLRVAPVFLPLLLLLGTGLRGLDFGTHWDEKFYQIGPVRTMLTTGILLPQYYGYPSLDYWINTAGLIPDVVATPPDGEGRRQHVFKALESHAYLMRLRATFLVITALSVLWVYLLVVVWRRSWVEALLAGLFLALSWEVAYHLRWVATDGMLMQFGALTLLCAMLSRLRQLSGRFWLQFAAVAAGLGCGTKYPGGLLFVPVLVGGYLLWDRKSSPFALIWLWVKLALIFTGVYLATTPATVLQPASFFAGLAYELHHYSTGHAGHTIAPGLEHGWRMFVYFSSVLFSRYAPIAWLFFLLTVVGGYSLVKEERQTATLFLCFPVLYLLYFCTQRAMVVRNLLVIVPFMAVLAARGTIFTWERLKLGVAGRAVGSVHLNLVQLGFAALMLTAFSINAGWLVYTAQTIADRNTDRFVREAAAYISANGGQQFFLSPRVRAHLTTVGPIQLPNVTDDPTRADEVILYAHEGVRRWQDWPANRFWLTTTWFGPYEVNFNVYPNWWGDDRIIVVPMARAKQIGILVVK